MKKKTILLALLIGLTIQTFAQECHNPAKYDFAENCALSIQYKGWIGGSYHVTLTNKQSCAETVKLRWLGHDSIVTVSSFLDVSLPGAYASNTVLSAKTETVCSCSDKCWLEILPSGVLGIKFSGLKVTKTAPFTYHISFKSEDDSKLDHFNIKIMDEAGKVFLIRPYFPDGIKGNHIYFTDFKTN